MARLLEFDVVAYLKDDKKKEEQDKYREMGINISSEEEEREEKLVKYAFDPTTLTEVRQTFVMYQGKWQDAVVATVAEPLYETPPLLVNYEQFKQKFKEWDETNKKTS